MALLVGAPAYRFQRLANLTFNRRSQETAMKPRKAFRKSEPQFEASEEIFHLLFRDHPLPMWVYDLETLAFLEVNHAAVKKYSYAREEFLRMTLKDIRPSEDRTHLLDDVAERQLALQHSGRRRHIVRNGRIIDVESTSHPLTYHGRKAYLVIVQDITEPEEAGKVIQESEIRHLSLFENMLEGFAYCRMLFEDDKPADFEYLEVNNAFEKITGLKDVVGKRVTEAIPGIKESNPELFKIYGRVAKTGLPERFDVYVNPLETWFSISVYTMHQGYFAAVFDNITERKRAEEQVKRLNRVYAVLSNINQAIVRIDDPQRLLEDACRIAVDDGQFKLAWIGMVNPGARKVEVVALHGATDDSLDKTALELNDDQRNSGPTGKAILTGIHAISNDIEQDASMLPWRENALRLGFRSSASFPLKVFGETRGTFSLYAAEVGFFDEDEIRLLNELAMDISFAMESNQHEAERKRVQEALSERERRFHQLYDEAPDGFHELDIQGRIVEINRTELEMLGYKAEEMLRHAAWEFIVESEISREAIAAKLAGSMPSDHAYERTFRRRDATTVNVLIKDRALRNEAGEIVGIRSAVQDITERKNAEQELRLMAQTVASAQDCISVTDLGNRLLFVNDAFRNTYGYTSEELLGKDVSILRPSHTPAAIIDRIFLDTLGGGWHGELMNRRKDGSDFPVELWTSVVKDEAGVPVALVGVARNISDRKEVEEHLRDSEEQFRLIAENVADMIAVVDLDGRRIYNSPSYESILGDPESLKATDGFQEIHPQDRERVKQVFQETVRTGIGQRIEYRFLLNNGSVRSIDSKGSVIRDSEGRISRVIIVSRDVTEEKRLAAQFLRAQRMESIGTLAGGIAHDLNNVLAPIMMAIEVLRSKISDPGGQRILTTIETSAKRGADIVRQVLAFGRGVKGDRILVQLKHVINEVVKIAGETFPKSIEIKTDIPRDLWTVSADPTQMHQVLLNLLVNARDAMPKGGTLTISAENIKLDESYSPMHPEAKPGAHVSIVITDTGTGIPTDIREKIFEPFFTTKEIGMGTGLGLSTTLAIVKSHAGFINLESELGHGTTFSVYIPATGTASSVAAAIEETDLPMGNGELILVIDDESAIREITRETLESYGYKVLSASDGAEGVAAFAENKKKIKAVITDIMMPVMDGTAAILALRKINPDVKIIATSGMTSKGQITPPLDSNVQAFLTKPYTAEKLLKALAATLR